MTAAVTTTRSNVFGVTAGAWGRQAVLVSTSSIVLLLLASAPFFGDASRVSAGPATGGTAISAASGSPDPGWLNETAAIPHLARVTTAATDTYSRVAVTVAVPGAAGSAALPPGPFAVQVGDRSVPVTVETVVRQSGGRVLPPDPTSPLAAYDVLVRNQQRQYRLAVAVPDTLQQSVAVDVKLANNQTARAETQIAPGNPVRTEPASSQPHNQSQSRPRWLLTLLLAVALSCS
jgi:hypothetical protein